MHFFPQQERPPGKLRTPLQHVLKDGLHAFIPQQERPVKFRTPLQHVLKDGLYAFVPQQERPPGEFRTPLQQLKNYLLI